MADYYPLIARAVADLPQNTDAVRRALYERARNALDTQLRGQMPMLSESEIARERQSLEEAICRVEVEADGKPSTAALRPTSIVNERPSKNEQNNTLVSSIKTKLNGYETRELLKMYKDNDRRVWSDEAFIAMREILRNRGAWLPFQRQFTGAERVEDSAGDRRNQSTAAPAEVQSAKTMWEVRSADGSIRSYDEKSAIVDAIMAGNIKPDWECRQVKVLPKKGRSKQPKWRTVERSFDVYRPVSRRMWKGGGIGMSIGITIAFALRILDATAGALMLGDPRFSGMALMSTFLFLSTLGPIAGEISPTIKDGVTEAAGKLGNFLFIIGFLLVLTQGFGVLLGVFLGLTGLGGILIIGGLFGGLPGLAIGTCVGLARRRSFALPPGASPQSSGRMVSLGILLPVTCFALGLFLFFQYFLPFTVKGSIELLNSPLFKFR